jgi:two-component system phosphate regulon sensor histidine kinase PhoR
MPMNVKFANLIESQREALLEEWRRQVRSLPSAKDLSDPRLNDHIPNLLDELVTALRVQPDESIPHALANMSAYSHGLQRLDQQFDLAEMVAEYNVLRGCIHDLAFEHEVALQGNPFRVLNRVLDGAIGFAVQTYATQQALEVRKHREEYLSFVAHDLRTPLNTISMITTVIERQTLSSSAPSIETPVLLKILRNNIGTLSSLVTNILNENTGLLTDTTIKVEPRFFELWALVEDIVQNLLPLKGKECNLSNEVSYDVVVYGDANLLRRVFQNLVANAIKFTPVGEIKIGAMNRGGEGAVECWVTDTGAGIPEERLAVIFQKLQTDSDRNDGLGLGLSIVETFVKAHNGEVTVESKEGIGSKFHILLPGPTRPEQPNPELLPIP